MFRTELKGKHDVNPKTGYILSCFGGYSDFSYFFPGLFRLLGWILGAVLGISAVSATFSQIFPDVGLGFGLVLEYNHKKNQTCY